MRCKKEDFIKGGYFHVYNHAVANENLLRDDQDYCFFTDKMQETANLKDCTLICWCLMPNHFHYLIRQDDLEPVYKVFNSVAMSYINYYNHKYLRKGRIFNKLQHRKVLNDNYLLQLCIYIHLNPVKDGFVNRPEDWQYSDYKKWTDNQSVNEMRDDIFDFGDDEYKKIVDDKMKELNWKKEVEKWEWSSK
jgi:REP-associated tyrosine transposase